MGLPPGKRRSLNLKPTSHSAHFEDIGKIGHIVVAFEQASKLNKVSALHEPATLSNDAENQSNQFFVVKRLPVTESEPMAKRRSQRHLKSGLKPRKKLRSTKPAWDGFALHELGVGRCSLRTIDGMDHVVWLNLDQPVALNWQSGGTRCAQRIGPGQ